VAVAAGSVWVGVLPDGFSCAIARLDATSLAVQATIPIACTLLAAQFVALGDELWYVDPTGTDIDGHGAHLRRLDVTTNTPDKAVDLPSLTGYLQSSGDAIFYSNNDDSAYRLLPGMDAFESIGPIVGPLYPAGDGVWAQADDATGTVAAFHTSAGGADTTVPIDGPLVGADAGGVYAELADPADGTPTLWRTDAATGAPVELLRGSRITTRAGEVALGFFDDLPVVRQGDRAMKLWVITSRLTPSTSEVLFTSVVP
jgi:hypothetical protein